MSAVSGAGSELLGAGAGGVSKAGRLSLLRRGAAEAGSVGADVGAVGIGSVGAGSAFGTSASGLVGVIGVVTTGAASARCRPARKGRD